MDYIIHKAKIWQEIKSLEQEYKRNQILLIEQEVRQSDISAEVQKKIMLLEKLGEQKDVNTTCTNKDKLYVFKVEDYSTEIVGRKNEEGDFFYTQRGDGFINKYDADRVQESTPLIQSSAKIVDLINKHDIQMKYRCHCIQPTLIKNKDGSIKSYCGFCKVEFD